MPPQPPSGPVTWRLDLCELPATASDLDVAVHADSGTPPVAVVSVRGELDIATTGQLRDCLRDVLRGGHVRLRLELGDLTFCDVAGLTVLLRAAREVRARGGELVLADPPRSLQRMIGTLGLTEMFSPRP